jgi:PAS domain S-box-containing protein
MTAQKSGGERNRVGGSPPSRPPVPSRPRPKPRADKAKAASQVRILGAEEFETAEILRSLSDPVFVFGPVGELLQVNAAALSLLGLASFVLGTSLKKILSGVTRRFPTGHALPPVLIGSQAALLGLPGRQRFVLGRPGAAELSIEAEAEPVRRNGVVVGAVEVWKNVTERSELLAERSRDRLEFEAQVKKRARAMAALWKNPVPPAPGPDRPLPGSAGLPSDLLARVFDAAGIFIAYLDPDFHYIQVNRAFARAAGRSVLALTGQAHFDLFPDPYFRTLCSQAMADGAPRVGHDREFFRGIDRADQPAFFDWSILPVAVPNGPVKGLLLTLVEVTRRRRAEAARRLLSSTIDQAQEPMLILNAQGAIQYANAAFRNMTGLGEESIQGRLYSDMAGRGLGRIAVQGALERCLQAGESWRGRVHRRIPSGGEAVLDVLFTPLRDERFRLANVSVIERDVTGEIAADEKRYRTSRARLESLGRMAGGIAHDFNGLLLPIILNAEMLLGEAGEPGPSKPHLRNILQAAHRAKSLVSQILVFSRESERGRGLYLVQPVIRETLALVRDILPSNVSLRSILDAPQAASALTPTQIHQVLMNLSANAIHAMRGQGGVLEVSLATGEGGANFGEDRSWGALSQGFVKLTVSDTGEGMSRDVMEKVFDPYFTTKEPGQGSGMGLAVVHGIIEANKGSILIKSEPGRGTTLDVYVPAIRRRISPGEPRPAGWSRKREHILLVEHEETAASIALEILESLGYRVTVQTDVPLALGHFKDQPSAFDLIIADQSLPDPTGIELALEILALRPDVPVLVALEPDAAQPEEGPTGIQGFIRKPYSPSELARVVRRTLDNTRPAPTG